MDEQQRQARLQRRRLEQQQRNREIVADMLRHPGEGPSYWGRLAHHLVSAHNEELAAYAWDQDRQHGRGAIFLAARHLADDVLSTSWLSRAEVDALHAEGGPLSDCQPPDWQDPAKFYYAVVWLPAGMHLSGHMQTTPAAEAGRPPKRNIVACTVGAESQEHPPTLRQLGSARCVGRRVIEWSSSLGSYGMGGPGFFGMRLAATPSYSEEWLVLVLWGAAHWLILDGR